MSDNTRSVGEVVENSDAGDAEEYWRMARLDQARESRIEAERLLSLALSEQSDVYARESLRSAAHAYWYAEGTSDAIEQHRNLHSMGAQVRNRFGCFLDWDGHQYSTSCPVNLSDKRLGVSIGYISKKLCSICGQDQSECEHDRSRLYWVRGGAWPLGDCRVCFEIQCSHSSDKLYAVPAVAIVKEIEQLDEVSFVDVPAMPLARLLRIPCDLASLQLALGPTFNVGDIVSCDHCLNPYHGLPDPVERHEQ